MMLVVQMRILRVALRQTLAATRTKESISFHKNMCQMKLKDFAIELNAKIFS